MSDLDYDGHSDQFDDQDNQYRGGYVDDILDDDIELNEQGTPTTTEALNLDECEDKVWLLKVPTFLADKWEEAMKEGADLGKLKFYNQEVYPEGTSSHTRMVLTLPESFEGIPRDYTLNVVNEKVENTYIFEEYNNKVAKKISGTVIRDLIANPFPTDPEYRSILRKRALDAGEKNRSVSLESQGRQLEYLKPSRGNGPGWGGLGKRSKLDVDSKAARLSEKDLMDMLFKLFAEYRFWSLKGLQKRTEQPVGHLKNVLKDITILNRKGKHHTLYQLKDEYMAGISHERTAEEDGPMNNPYNNPDGNSPAAADASDVVEGEDSEQNSSDMDDFLEVDG